MELKAVRVSRFIKERTEAGLLRPSYNYCGLCGYVPGKYDLHNYAPVKWWDADDGWKITTLCYACMAETFDDRPQPGDYAYDTRRDLLDDNVNTDEDESLALY